MTLIGWNIPFRMLQGVPSQSCHCAHSCSAFKSDFVFSVTIGLLLFLLFFISLNVWHHRPFVEMSQPLCTCSCCETKHLALVILAPSFFLSLSFFPCIRSVAPKWALSVYKCVYRSSITRCLLQTACFESARWNWNRSQTGRTVNDSSCRGNLKLPLSVFM